MRAEGEYWVADNAVVVGRVLLKQDASVWFNAVLRGDNDLITVGEGSNVQDGSILHTDPGYPLVIGPHVTIGHKVMLHGCRIGNRVLIGMGAIILDGAVIEDEVIVGAGALVTPGKHLESGFLYVGSPARKVRPLKDSERAYFVDTAQNYITLKNVILKLQLLQ